MQMISGALIQILNVIKETFNRLLGLVDLALFFIGFRPFKKLRLRVVVLRGPDGQPMATETDVALAVAEMTRVFERNARTRVVAAEPLVVIGDAVAPYEALNVHCDDGAWQEDFGLTGAYFRKACARSLVGTLLGYGAPVTVFVVQEISGKGGCSLGPLTDYVTQEARTVGQNRLMAHEVAHACGLWHSEDTPNLMYPRRPGDFMASWQAAIFRGSRHVTYI
jgi:hypothetical protein